MHCVLPLQEEILHFHCVLNPQIMSLPGYIPGWVPQEGKVASGVDGPGGDRVTGKRERQHLKQKPHNSLLVPNGIYPSMVINAMFIMKDAVWSS